MRFPPVLNVRNGQESVGAFFGHIQEHQRRAPKCADQIGNEHREDQGREDAPDSSRIELGERKSVSLEVVQNIAANQIARNDKEDVHADEAALERFHLEMEQHDSRDGKRPQTCYFAPKAGHLSLISTRRIPVAGMGCSINDRRPSRWRRSEMHQSTISIPSSAADLKSLYRKPRNGPGTSNRKAALES